MVNFELLEKKMDEKDVSRAEMIRELDIDESTWYRKRKNPQSLTIGAAEIIIKVLDLSEKEADDIFDLRNLCS